LNYGVIRILWNPTGRWVDSKDLAFKGIKFIPLPPSNVPARQGSDSIDLPVLANAPALLESSPKTANKRIEYRISTFAGTYIPCVHSLQLHWSYRREAFAPG